MAEVATSRSSFWLARSLLYLLRMRGHQKVANALPATAATRHS
jgi:hypothetical protein